MFLCIKLKYLFGFFNSKALSLHENGIDISYYFFPSFSFSRDALIYKVLILSHDIDLHRWLTNGGLNVAFWRIETRIFGFMIR